jgi:hypothetical protein
MKATKEKMYLYNVQNLNTKSNISRANESYKREDVFI